MKDLYRLQFALPPAELPLSALSFQLWSIIAKQKFSMAYTSIAKLEDDSYEQTTETITQAPCIEVVDEEVFFHLLSFEAVVSATRITVREKTDTSPGSDKFYQTEQSE